MVSELDAERNILKVANDVLTEEFVGPPDAADGIVWFGSDLTRHVTVGEGLHETRGLVLVRDEIVAGLVERDVPGDVDRVDWQLIVGEVADLVVDGPEELERNCSRRQVPNPEVRPEEDTLCLWPGQPRQNFKVELERDGDEQVVQCQWSCREVRPRQGGSRNRELDTAVVVCLTLLKNQSIHYRICPEPEKRVWFSHFRRCLES